MYDLVLALVAFYIGGACSIFQMCSIGVKDDGTRLKFITRLFTALTWPAMAFIWSGDDRPTE